MGGMAAPQTEKQHLDCLMKQQQNVWVWGVKIDPMISIDVITNQSPVISELYCSDSAC